MKTIRIISGAYGWHDKNGSVRPKKRGDEFEVDDGEAMRLVDLGIAQIAGEKLSDDTLYGEIVQSFNDFPTGNDEPVTPDGNAPESEDEEMNPDGDSVNVEENERSEGKEANAEEDNSSESEDVTRPEYSADDTPAQLREIAASIGVKFPFGATKEKMVEILDDYFDSAESSEGDVDLTPADPE